MRLSFMKFAVSFFIATLLCCPLQAADKKAKGDVFFIADTIVLGNNGVKECLSALQGMFDKEYGKNKIEIKSYSFFDLNTSQALKLARNVLEKQDVWRIIVMIGEGNFYNLNGFSDYLSYEGKYLPLSAVISPQDPDAVFKLNIAVADFYNSIETAASSPLKYSASAAYRQIAGNEPKAFNGYKAKIIPSFALLRTDTKSYPDVYFAEKNKLAWNYISQKQYGKAEDILREMLAGNQQNSGIYYALGSLYLTRDKKHAEAALSAFMNGIMLNPFDPGNKCYKALALMFMSYKGKILNEILYFSGVLKSFIGEISPEINAICAINSTDYDQKMSDINKWIISDIKQLDDLCRKKGVELIVNGYPSGAKAENVLRSIPYSVNTVFVDNSSISLSSNRDRNKVYLEMAEKLFTATKRK